jgi:DNA-binding NarL/FixJ family response regulator
LVNCPQKKFGTKIDVSVWLILPIVGMTAQPSGKQMNLAIADAHPIFLAGLKALIGQYGGGRFRINISGAVRTGLQMADLVRSGRVDVLVCDITLPDTEGSKLIASLKKIRPDLKILVVTAEEDPRMVKAAFRAGADGYLLKTANETEVFGALESVLEGRTYIGDGVKLLNHARGTSVGENSAENRFARYYGLTKRELEVMRLIGQAMNNKEISGKLFISDQTVSVHRKNIMRKLRVNNTAHLIKIAFENNLVG